MITDMFRNLFAVISIMVMLGSCKTEVVNEQENNIQIELKSQLIGVTSAHNARQLGGYPIGDKQIKNNVLLRSAKLSELTAEDSTLLCDKTRCSASTISVARMKVFLHPMSFRERPDTCLLRCRLLAIIVGLM